MAAETKLSAVFVVLGGEWCGPRTGYDPIKLTPLVDSSFRSVLGLGERPVGSGRRSQMQFPSRNRREVACGLALVSLFFFDYIQDTFTFL